MKTGLYNLEDTKKIIAHYKEKLIGLNIGNDQKKLIITQLDTENYENNKYRIICKCSPIGGGFLPFQSIENVLEKFNLPQPNEIITDL